MLALQVDGASVETVEGLTATGEAGALQESFVACGGFQCGICTPGQIVAATALLRECGAPQEDDVKRWMTGNICRCTGYYQIVEAVRVAAGASRG